MAIYLSPAKINFGLKVLGRRTDGFHTLSMLNGILALADTLEIQVNTGNEISIEAQVEGCKPLSNQLDSPEQNLAGRAASLVLQTARVHADVSIKLLKRIPIGGGLGGGSSNAACVLAMLPGLLVEAGLFAKCDLDTLRESLFEQSVNLGADVPYFLRHNAAISHVSGVGEVIEPLDLEGVDDLPVFLILPDFSLATAEVFSSCRELDFSRTPLYRKGVAGEVLDRDWLTQHLVNDLLEPAIRTDSRIAQLVTLGKSIPDIIFGMTGSGSTLFAIPSTYTRDGATNQIADQLAEAFYGHSLQIIQTKLLAKLSY